MGVREKDLGVGCCFGVLCVLCGDIGFCTAGLFCTVVFFFGVLVDRSVCDDVRFHQRTDVLRFLEEELDLEGESGDEELDLDCPDDPCHRVIVMSDKKRINVFILHIGYRYSSVM